MVIKLLFKIKNLIIFEIINKNILNKMKIIYFIFYKKYLFLDGD